MLLLNNQRLRNLLQPYVEIALCLNWIDECIVTAIVFLFVCFFFFLFIMLYDIKCMSKGKVKQIQREVCSSSVYLLFACVTVKTEHSIPGNLWRVLRWGRNIWALRRLIYWLVESDIYTQLKRPLAVRKEDAPCFLFFLKDDILFKFYQFCHWLHA